MSDSDLARRAVRLALAGWVNPERLQQALAHALAAGHDPDAAAAIAMLEGQASRRRPLPREAEVDAACRRLARLGATVVIVGERGYPHGLAAAWPELGAPLWLVVQAAEQLPSGRTVAVVGTRRPSHDGLATARALGRLLAEHDVTVVSGMARGIDQAAHRGALDAGGRTVAVLGTGLGVDYPVGSGALRRAVAAAGGLVTELPPGAPPRPQQFLWRNRIISGQADATVVVEGRARSGALQTARLAAAQGRDVLAVPGSPNQPTARAPLDLIRDGARPVTRLEDVLDAVGVASPHEHAPGVPAQGLDPAARQVLELVGAVPVSANALAAAADAAVPVVLAALGELDRRGLVTATTRGYVAVPHGR